MKFNLIYEIHLISPFLLKLINKNNITNRKYY